MSTPTVTQDTLRSIPTKQIVAGDNDRKDFDKTALANLAASIEKHGLLQPITVRKISRYKFEIIAGERRFRACHDILKWKTIPAFVKEVSDEEAAALMLLENMARVDLDPIAEARAYNVRIEKFGWDTERVAQTAGVNRGLVEDRLKLLSLVPDIQHFISTRQFPIGHAMLLIDLDANRQRIALRIFNAAKTMPLSRFREEVVSRLSADQAAESQMGLFALEMQIIEEVQDDDRVLKGKKARTGAPVNRSLPRVRVSQKDSVHEIMDRYIADLLASGEASAAGAIGNLYNTLVAMNWMSVPVKSQLAKTSDIADTAEELAHCAPFDSV